MNTPKTRKPKRWLQPTITKHHPDGRIFGIRNLEVASEFGYFVSYWWHLEEQMLFVLEELITGDPTTALLVDSASRTIFRSVVSQDARIKIMQNLLSSTKHNSLKPETFEEILEEFGSLNNIRNEMVHGVWHTTPDLKVVTRSKAGFLHETLTPEKQVKSKELTDLIRRMHDLNEKIAWRHGKPSP